MTTQSLATLLVAVLIGFGGYGMRRFSLLKTANETIELLNSRIDALERRGTERDIAYAALENKCAVLQEVVTNAAEVHNFREDYLVSVSQVNADHQRILSRVDNLSELLGSLVLEQRKGE